MANIGVLIETDANAVKDANFGVLTAAAGDGGNAVVAIVMDADAAACQAVLAENGAARIVAVQADLSSSPDLQAAALAEMIQKFELTGLLALSSASGRDVLARLAAKIDAPLVLDCVGIDPAAATVKKSHFSGKTFATIKLQATPFVVGIRPNAIEANPAAAAGEMVEFTPATSDGARVHIKEVKQGDGAQVDLTEANIIITGGRPIGSADNYKILRDCAEALGSGTAVGASRAAVDAGYAPHGMQVGQTGKTVSPKLYIGCGLSGSVQHFAGMKTSKVIVAINTDKDAPIFEKCDYGILGDMFAVVPVLTETLKG